MRSLSRLMLGCAMAPGLTAAGAPVVATAARHEEPLMQVAEAGRGRPGAGAMVPVRADVTREEDCARVVHEAFRRFGVLHILLNNAGRGMRFVNETFTGRPTRFWEVDMRI